MSTAAGCRARHPRQKKTVAAGDSRILAKLRLRDRIQAVVFAYEAGVTLPGPVRTGH